MFSKIFRLRKFESGRNLNNGSWEDSRSLKYKFITLFTIGAVFLVISGCYKSEVKDFWASRNSPVLYKSLVVPFKGTSWAPRRASAKITQETELELKKKGYIKIGEIEIKKYSGVCYRNSQFGKSVTERLLGEAAKRGGDLVFLTKDNVLQKDQKMVLDNDMSVYARESEQSVYPSVSGSYPMGCTQFRVSSGTVWREMSDHFPAK